MRASQALLIASRTAKIGRRSKGAAVKRITIFLLPLLCLPVQAQDRAVNESESAYGLPTVIVTAQKTRQTLEEVPASVTAIDGDSIRAAGLSSFTEMQDYAANVTISLSGSAGTYGIRGFTTPDTNVAFDPSVGMVVDGVSYGRSNFLSAFFFDVDRFEVLRGPQGTLFGKNATAGLFNLTTNAPEREFSLMAEAQYSDFGELQLRPAINLPLGDTLSLRLSGNYQHGADGLLYNSYLDRPEVDARQDSTRLRLRWEPGANWTVDLGAFTSDYAQNFNIFQLTEVGDNMLALARSYDAQAEAEIDTRTSANYPSREESRFDGASLSVDYRVPELLDLSDAIVTSISAWGGSKLDRKDIDADFTAIPFIHDSLVEPSRFHQYSQELQLSAKADDLFGWGHGVSFVTGLYVYDARFQTSDRFQVEDLDAALCYVLATQADQGTPLPTCAGPLGGVTLPTLNLLLDIVEPIIGEQHADVGLDQSTRAYAYFGQFEHFVFEHWAIIGGLRWGYESKEADAYSRGTPLIAAITGGGQSDHDTHIRRVEHDLSPKAGLKWAPNKLTSAYFTWSQGYKSGGFNGLPLSDQNLEYEPELATSYEIGGKAVTELFGGPLRLSTAMFSTDFDDLQVSTFRGASFVILNAAAARSRGIEADVHWLPPIGRTSIFTSLGYNDAYYTKYSNAPARSDSGDDTQDLSGEPLAFAPRWSATLTPATSFDLGSRIDATIAVDAIYRSERFLDLDNDPRKQLSATTVYNARLVLSDPSQTWSLALGAHNLTDELLLDQAVSQPLAAGNFVAVRTDRGRYYTFNLSYSFQ